MDDERNDERIAVALADGQAIVIDAWLGAPAALALRTELLALLADGSFTRAGVGAGSRHAIESDVRRDRVCWFGDNKAGHQAAGERVTQFLARLDTLMQHLNRTCFLALRTVECHAACYDAGAFYAEHTDALRADARRVISYCYYLNDWSAQDGGCLRLHGDTGQERALESAQDIAPQMDRLVVFLSAAQSHEVLPTTVQRLSLTGWLSRAA